jgi:predicted dehydrogenase
MDEGKLGVAVHGAGNVSRAHAAAWKRNPHCRIVSVSSRRRESAERLAQEAGLDCEIRERFEDVLADSRVDIVNISGPNHIHAPQGIAAAEAGKHLMMEKPMCLSMRENRLLRDAVARSGVKSVVSFVLRWNPLVRNLKALLAVGAIGELFYVEVDYWHGLSGRRGPEHWYYQQAFGGSTMLLGGCHAVDALRWLASDEVVEVCAFSNNPRRCFQYDANVVAILRFRGGAVGKTSALSDCEMPYQFNIDLAGTQGTLRDNRLWSKKLLPGQTGWSTMATVVPESGSVHHHPFDAQFEDLVECIRADRESHCNIADGYRTHEVCLAIDRSIAAGGRPVKLPLEDE